MTDDALVIFTPSGKRGRFALGTPVLTAARQLGVDLDSVCGGRGICSKCQITPGYGEFSKHGVTVAEVLVGQLAEARGVEVEALDPDAIERTESAAEGRDVTVHYDDVAGTAYLSCTLFGHEAWALEQLVDGMAEAACPSDPG